MKLINLLKISLVITITMTLKLANAGEHEHGHGHEKSTDKKPQVTSATPTLAHSAITLNNGNKWSIDQSLHIGMTRIKTAIETHIKAIHFKTFESKEYEALASEVQSHLSYLFTHCKLPSDADKQLHSLLYSIMQGNEKMSVSDNKRAGAIEIIKALQHYPQYFDDANWQPLQH